MRKQDRIAREQQQNRPQEPLRKASPPDPGTREQVKGSSPTPNRPPRVPGKLPLPD
jgi:hypothetical protein